MLAAIGNQAVDEAIELRFTAAATDPDDPPNTLRFSLDPGAPVGAQIDPMSGVFTWTPTEGDGPGTFDVTIRVRDDGNPPQEDSETIRITVAEINLPPSLGPIGSQTIDEGVLFTLPVSATDADVPSNVLTFTLDSGAPAGAQIDPITGVFMWTSTEAQGPGTYPITVRVRDDGSTVGEDFETFDVTVREVNQPPVLATHRQPNDPGGQPAFVHRVWHGPGRPTELAFLQSRPRRSDRCPDRSSHRRVLVDTHGARSVRRDGARHR